MHAGTSVDSSVYAFASAMHVHDHMLVDYTKPKVMSGAGHAHRLRTLMCCALSVLYLTACEHVQNLESARGRIPPCFCNIFWQVLAVVDSVIDKRAHIQLLTQILRQVYLNYPPIDGGGRVSSVSSDPRGRLIFASAAEIFNGGGSGGSRMSSEPHLHGAGPAPSASSVLQTYRSLYPDSKVELA